MYEKKISKPLRKLGHLNIVGTDNQTIDELLNNSFVTAFNLKNY